MGSNHDNEYIQCPYNEAHMILSKRVEVHLVRCRRSYPLAEKAVCPFNNNHRINKVELNWHVKICPERREFEQFRHALNPIVGLSSSIDDNFCGGKASDISQKIDIEGSENWDPQESWDEIEPIPYDPNAYAADADIVRQPVGLKPAERSAFRESERRRLQNLKGN